MNYYTLLLCICLPAAALQSDVAHYFVTEDAVKEKLSIHHRQPETQLIGAIDDRRFAEHARVSLTEQGKPKVTASRTGAEASDSKTGGDAEEVVARHSHKRHSQHHKKRHHGQHSHRHSRSHSKANRRAEKDFINRWQSHSAAEEPQNEIELKTEENASVDGADDKEWLPMEDFADLAKEAEEVDATSSTNSHPHSHDEPNFHRNHHGLWVRSAMANTSQQEHPEYRHQAVYQRLLSKAAIKVPRKYHPVLLQRSSKRQAVTKLLEEVDQQVVCNLQRAFDRHPFQLADTSSTFNSQTDRITSPSFRRLIKEFDCAVKDQRPEI